MSKTQKNQSNYLKNEQSTPFQKLRETKLDKYNKPISRKELATRLSKYYPGIDEKKIERIENGRVKSIDIDIYKAYMQYFSVSADFLLGFSDIPKRFDNNVIAFADYLGLSRKSVETIHNMIDTSSLLDDTASMSYNDVRNFMSDHYKKTENNEMLENMHPDYETISKISGIEREQIDKKLSENDKKIENDFIDIAKKAGFAFDLLLSSPGDYNCSVFCIELFYNIYCMIEKRVQYLTDNNTDSNAFRMYLYDIEQILQGYMKNLNKRVLEELTIDFDKLHNTDMYIRLFGDRL